MAHLVLAQKAYSLTTKALGANEQLTFPDEEIDLFLPINKVNAI